MSTAGEKPDAESLRKDIEESREELGDTVEALAGKADVKGRAKAKVEEGKEELRELKEGAKAKARSAADQAKEQPAPTGGIVAAVLGALGIAWLMRRRRRRKRDRAS
jgi:MYXO-CTERM domain-containing protein